MNLLIVDDEIIAVKGMMSGINWTNCGIDGEVWTAYDANQATEILQREIVDVILCDIEMPGKNGIELIRKVHDEYSEIAVIFLTCHAKFEYAQEAIRLECLDYILTPAPYEIIADTIQKAVNMLSEKRQKQNVEKYGFQWLSQQERQAESVQGESRKISEIVEDTITYILANLASEKLSITDLAQRNFLHEDYLNRIFKREKGIPLNQYIIQERMNLAARLLQNPSLGVAVIANQVGYSNYSYFASTFKKTFGYTPTQYRKQCLGLEE